MAVHKIDRGSIEYTQISAITGDSYKERYLYYQLKLAIAKAKSIDIIVSFLMESGVRMLLKDLQGAFNDLFENYSTIIDDKELKRYSKNWHKPAVTKDLARFN